MIYLIYIGGALFTCLCLYLFISALQSRKEKEFLKTPKKVLRIRVSSNNERSAKVAEYIFSCLETAVVKESLINTLLGKKADRFSFEIANIDKQIFFYVWCPKKYKGLILSQIYAQYPDIEVEEVKDYVKGVNKDQLSKVIAAEIETDNHYYYPLKRHSQFEDLSSKTFLDPLSAITSAFDSLPHKSDQAWFQLVVSPLDSSWRKRAMFVLDHVSGGFFISSSKFQDWYIKSMLDRGPKKYLHLFFTRPLLTIIGLAPKRAPEGANLGGDVQESSQRENEGLAINGKLSQLGFHVNMRYIYLANNSDKRAAKIKLKDIIASFNQFNLSRFNSLTVRSFDETNKLLLKRFYKRSLVAPFILSTEELATIWHLPHETVDTPNLQKVNSKKLQAPLNLPVYDGPSDSVTAIGMTNYRGHQQKYGIKDDDRRRHIYIIGKTGMGKSTILENMIASDIENNRGVAVIDPHGDLADAVLNFIPKSRTNQVLIFDPSDKDFPVSFNMLECRTPEQRHLVASGLLGVFKKMFGDSWGPRLEHILRNTILALTEMPGATILGIMKMLTDDDYREKVLAKVTDGMVLSFWKDEFGKWQPRQKVEAVAPIQNKVGQFLSSSLVRNVFGQPKSSLDLRFAMDTQKIVIVNLSKGKIGEDNSSLLGSMFITKFQLDAMSRANIAKEERKDFYLYVDEFQNFATDSFATILSEARKYKLNLTMANQYIDQMTDDVKAAVFGNVGSMIVGQVGAADAEIFAKQFSEQVEANDIINLPKYKSYVKLMIDGVSSQVFSSDNLVPPTQEHLNLADKETIVRLSRERYAKKREFVEEKIGQWMESPK